MDITVAPNEDGKTWALTDLLGRDMGSITRSETGKFTIYPGHAVATMAGLPAGPYVSLDDALARIEKLTRGVCRMAKAKSP